MGWHTYHRTSVPEMHSSSDSNSKQQRKKKTDVKHAIHMNID